MNTTTNLGLKKPEYTDPADIEDLNYNAGVIDAAISGLQSGLAYVAEKDGSDWKLPSGTNAVAGDYIVVDNVLGQATTTITGASTVIASGTNWTACANDMNKLVRSGDGWRRIKAGSFVVNNSAGTQTKPLDTILSETGRDYTNTIILWGYAQNKTNDSYYGSNYCIIQDANLRIDVNSDILREFGGKTMTVIFLLKD